MFKFFRNKGFNAVATFFIVVGLMILAAAISLAWFTLGYWLITIILANFFAYTLPFSWNYALGGWLIAVIVGTFITPFFRVKLNSE